MLDKFTIFTKGGLVLWTTKDTVAGNPIEKLIASVLLEERGDQTSFSDGKYTVKWTLANDLDLIFVFEHAQAVYQRVLTNLNYVDSLLDEVKKAFCAAYFPDGRKLGLEAAAVDTAAFDEKFRKILERVEMEAMSRRNAPRPMRSFEETEKGKKAAKSKKQKDVSNSPEPTKTTTATTAPAATESASPAPAAAAEGPQEAGTANGGDTDVREPESQEASTAPVSPEQAIKERLKALSAARGRGRGGKLRGRGSKIAVSSSTPQKRSGKAATVWEEKLTKEEEEALFVNREDEKRRAAEMGSSRRPAEYFKREEEPSSEEEEDLPEDESAAAAAGGKRGLFSFFSNLTNKVVERADLEPVLARFREHLVAKNVAAEIADRLCESVLKSLEGTRQSSFKSLSSTVKAAIEEALVKVLTPKRQVDILRDVMALRQGPSPRPYSIVFVGVNGVGKSTNLAKVCYWLKQNNLKVMIAACDTFRSAAVEQLRVHAESLNVFLYERGYGKDAANVAQEAIHYARENDYDVVLIDTAGRMENNEPLMRALTKLIAVNRPDLILFVGEALVGNKAVEQLTKFNQALIDMSNQPNPRTIDGILLTKFDTIDDKFSWELVNIMKV